jgi:hypothetical protein
MSAVHAGFPDARNGLATMKRALEDRAQTAGAAEVNG